MDESGNVDVWSLEGVRNIVNNEIRKWAWFLCSIQSSMASESNMQEPYFVWNELNTFVDTCTRRAVVVTVLMLLTLRLCVYVYSENYIIFWKIYGVLLGVKRRVFCHKCKNSVIMTLHSHTHNWIIYLPRGNKMNASVLCVSAMRQRKVGARRGIFIKWNYWIFYWFRLQVLSFHWGEHLKWHGKSFQWILNGYEKYLSRISPQIYKN